MPPSAKEHTDSRQLSALSKPYYKLHTSIIDVHDEKQDLAQDGSSPDRMTVSLPGFPTFEKYKAIEAEFLSLYERREKSIIPRAMFDRIWEVLGTPDTNQENPQFRFWVRSMFSLSQTPSTIFDQEVPEDASGLVMLHEGRMVAVQEQIYQILCFCHGRCKHAGRDSTQKLIRKNYSFVPKELVRMFVKECPTCTDKKTAQIERAAARQARSQAKNSTGRATGDVDTSISSIGTSPSISSDSVHTTDKENNPYDEDLGLLSSSSSSSILPSLTPLFHRTSMEASASKDGLQSLPMSREVSLYQGLPNGWQFHTDYNSALTEFLRQKDDLMLQQKRELQEQSHEEEQRTERKRDKRPRIPSVAPLRNSHSNLNGALRALDAESHEAVGEEVESAAEASAQGSLKRWMPVLVPAAEKEERTECVIDPVLLALSGDTGASKSDVTFAAPSNAGRIGIKELLALSQPIGGPDEFLAFLSKSDTQLSFASVANASLDGPEAERV